MNMFPYTDEQVREFADALGYRPISEVAGYVRTVLQDLHDYGITVRFPEPRFRAAPLPAGAWGVLEGHETVVYFSGLTHPDPEGSAKSEAGRLNWEATP